jgi:hypothetical protein
MKQTILKTTVLFITATFFTACNSEQSNAVELAKQTQSAIKKSMPGSIPVSANGYSMHAKINGKNWEATTVMPVDAAGRILGDNNGVSISLPLYGGKATLKQGLKTTFSENEAVDLMTNDEVSIWGGRKGEMEVTKMDENFAEGRFYFTANTNRSDKTIEVTDGYFRIPLAKDGN